MGTANRIPVSVRISQEDADFIAQLQLNGATTPSEKIRELLSEARLAHTHAHDYSTALGRVEQLINPARRDMLVAEKNLGVHSPLIARAFELVPDLMAILSVQLPVNSDLTELKHHEREIMWRLVRLMDGVLQLAITGRAAAYDDKVLNELQNTLKLAGIVSQLQENS